MAEGFGPASRNFRWAIGATVLTTAVAIVDLSLGTRAILIGTYVLGPLLAALRCGPRETGAIAAYSIVLGFFSGSWNEIMLETEHLTRLLPLAIGAALAVFIAHLRLRLERTRDHLVAQNALAVIDKAIGSIDSVS